MHWIFPLLILVLVGVALLVIHDRSIIRRVRRGMGARPRRDDAEFGALFPPGEAEIAVQVRELIAAQEPKLDLSRLEPSDRFADDLRLFELDSMAAAELLLAIEERFGVEFSDAEAQQLLTVQDVVQAINRQVSGTQ